MKNLFIIILNWKRAEETLQCIESLQKINIPRNIKCNLLIVDNDSGDDSIKKFKKIKSKFNLEVVENKENYGFAGGNNVGLKFAMNMMADYMIILNNDTRVDKNFAAKLIKAVDKNKSIGIASPKIYFEKQFEFHKDRYKDEELGKVIWYAGGEIDWNNIYGKNIGVDEVDEGQFEKTKDLDFTTGACFLITRDAILKAGFFDERYFMYLEDMDLSQRVLNKNLKIKFIPTSKIWHKVAQSSCIGSGLNDYFITRNRLFFAEKYANKRARFALYREALKFLVSGRKMQKVGVADYIKRNLGKGSWKN